jgi:hypothetical protein
MSKEIEPQSIILSLIVAGVVMVAATPFFPLETAGSFGVIVFVIGIVAEVGRHK